MVRQAHHKSPRARLLSAVFAEASKRGISEEELRGSIARNLIKKRLSVASAQELIRVLEHITGKVGKPRYKSSRKGLIEETEGLAKELWGDDFEKSLNKFVNSHRETSTHYKFLSVRKLVAFKKALVRIIKEKK